jgi:hypothetical protein
VSDDWRITIEVAEEHAPALLERFGLDLGSEARELAKELEGRRLAVSQDGETIFVYAGSRPEAERAREIVEAELREAGADASVSRVEHWLAGEERWDDEPAEEYEPEHDVLERGDWPWEVRVEAATPDAAEELARQLRDDGRTILRRSRYVIVGAASEEEARELASRLHGQVEAARELVYEVLPQNPFAIFGGLGGTGTPI